MRAGGPGVGLGDGPDVELFVLVGLGRSFFICCLAHRGSAVGFLLLRCSGGVVRHPGGLRVSVAARFCRVLIFASSRCLSVVCLFHVMVRWWVGEPPRGPGGCVFWAMVEADGGVGYPWGRFGPPPGVFVLAVPGRSFCCGSLLLLVLDVCVCALVRLLCW